MHSFGHRWTLVIALFIVGLTMGCRGSNPFGRFVQVSKAPDTGLPDIQAPPQRLATAKPRVEVEAAARPTRQSASRRLADDSPHVTKASSSDDPSRGGVDRGAAPKESVARQSQRSPSRRSQASAKNPSTKQSLASMVSQSNVDSKERSGKDSDAKRKAQDAVDHFAENAPDTMEMKQGAKKPKADVADKMESVAVKDSVQSELIAKFSDYPPEVQKEALRRLVEATSRSAERTTQPNSLEKQLASIAELPKLPEFRNSKPEISPTRLATDLISPLSSADIMQSDSKAGSLGLPMSSNSVTDLLTTELESVVKIASEAMGEESEVQTASASRDGDESELIARASVEEPAHQLADQMDSSASDEMAKKVEEGAMEDPAIVGTDQELYGTLLKRLSTAKPEESEAERSSRLIKLRHLMVLAGNPDDAVAKIDGMSKTEQEYLRHQLLGLWTMIDPDGHPIASRRFSTAVPQIREAAKFAAAATDTLEVRSLAFCTEIESYGQIKPFAGNRFNPGQQVIMYCEIENFTAKKTDGGYETNLQGSYDVYNSEDEKVISQLLPADQQVSSNYLRDYFIAYQMHLPQQLEGGTYRMQLTMEDVNGKKYGQTSIPFEIAK